ncbi:hypothetical protein [Arthrobacter sp. zg-Y1110]|uniref:hypothetical protein n=1 Tax=Arthrobacter sp. zg-Y1110 TaxID=2886932 RepID=UPI001D137D3D|nr:hypothetical protein [Arthrobacter sp. zg-Y1110]MCC3290619.1 hypothetical protein [Arthrobacter sp. zg-Y1110]UWX84020.1 hypothetical protein N2K99_11020 [Arthrobacter sp. zg-Y1110]
MFHPDQGLTDRGFVEGFKVLQGKGSGETVRVGLNRIGTGTRGAEGILTSDPGRRSGRKLRPVYRQTDRRAGCLGVASLLLRLLAYAWFFSCRFGVSELIHTSGFHPALTFRGRKQA